jgi:uncharacterized protein
MVNSPCIQVCLLSGEICVGCGRTKKEIADWSFISDNERELIKDRSLKRLEQVYEEDNDKG